MGKTCLKCDYERQPDDQAPEYACPACGAVYAKMEAVLRQEAEAGGQAPHPPAAHGLAEVDGDTAKKDGQGHSVAGEDGASQLSHPIWLNRVGEWVGTGARRWWVAGAVFLLLLAVVLWSNSQLLQSESERDIKRYRLNLILASPSIVGPDNPLNSERDPQRRRLLAARLFVEFYMFNMRERPSYCEAAGVELQHFPFHFARIHQSELATARRALNGESEDLIYSDAHLRMRDGMDADMTRLADELHTSSRGVCHHLEDNAEHVAWRMHIAAAAPAINGILDQLR